MKRNVIAMSVMFVLSGLSVSTVSIASLNNLLVKYNCPTKLHNLSSSITGIGSQQISYERAQNLQFKGDVPPLTPLNLSTYFNSNTKYDEYSGKVSCQYLSTFGWPMIYVSYNPLQSRYGIVVKQTVSEIYLKIPFGLHG